MKKKAVTMWTAFSVGLAASCSYAFDNGLVGRIGRGMNIGNALEAPSEGAWGVVIQEEYFTTIADAGFNSVRIPIAWHYHASTSEPYSIDETFFSRIDWVIEKALANHLAIVIDMHHYEELNQTPTAQKPRFFSMWRQIAERYTAISDSLIFELINEPNTNLGADTLNRYQAELVPMIREISPSRPLILTTTGYSDLYNLDDVRLPADTFNIAVAVHYYTPFEFTHQGASWIRGSRQWLGTQWNGTTEEKERIAGDLDSAAAWSSAHGIPIYVSEFGAITRADAASRERWIAFVVQSCEERGFCWAYWDFCTNFGVYNRTTSAWNTALLAALTPATTGASFVHLPASTPIHRQAKGWYTPLTVVDMAGRKLSVHYYLNGGKTASGIYVTPPLPGRHMLPMSVR